jgi:hypothetical protein
MKTIDLTPDTISLMLLLAGRTAEALEHQKRHTNFIVCKECGTEHDQRFNCMTCYYNNYDPT